MSLITSSIDDEVLYPIPYSLRFRSSASTYLSRTFGTATSMQIGTFSFWVKRGALTVSTGGSLFSDYTAGGPHHTRFGFTDGGDTLKFIEYASGAATCEYTTTAVFRDPSAWYHIVLVLDTTAAAGSRVKMYCPSISGTTPLAVTVTTEKTAGSNWRAFTSNPHYLGYNAFNGSYFDGYMADFYHVDGQALTPSSFGQPHPLGLKNWMPKRYRGTYGANGFYLDFKDGTSLTSLGFDKSGYDNQDIRGNYWTLSGFSLTAGATYDWMRDSPTQNYCTLSPNDVSTNTTLTDANLTFYCQNGVGNVYAKQGTMWGAGKFYFEVNVTNGASTSVMGTGAIGCMAYDPATIYGNRSVIGYGSNDYCWRFDGYKVNANVATSFGTAVNSNTDVVMCAYDTSNNSIWYGKNGVWFGSGDPATGTNPSASDSTRTDLSYYFKPVVWSQHGGSGTAISSANFGQRPFAYTPPTGFKALCTSNLPAPAIPDPSKHFDVKLHSGTAATQSITGIGFQPDLVWGKARNSPENNNLFDAVRGVTLALRSNTTDAESTQSGVTSFDSSGFTLGSGALNNSGSTYVDWLFNMGGSTVTNTNGSISSQVRANATAGMSVVTWTGNGSTGTIGHGLSSAPKLIITKYRNSVNAWLCYHSTLGAGSRLYLNQTDAAGASSTVWNNTSPTSSVFSVGDANTNGSGGTYVAYCFTEIPGFSKIGSYQGNGSTDGPMVFCGFKPRWVLIRRTDTAGNWFMYDAARGSYNPSSLFLLAESSGAEQSSIVQPDFVSNGFKVRTTDSGENFSGSTYIYLAIAETPFGIPGAAR